MVRSRAATARRQPAASQSTSAQSTPIRSASGKAARRQLPETHIELRIWLRLFGIATKIERSLAERLRREFKTSMSRFDLLSQLHRSDCGLSMSELSAKVMITNGAITGLVDKLAAEGLVRRQSHPADRRAMLVKLTAHGRRNFLKMADRHEDWVIELLGKLPTPLKRGLHDHLAAAKHELEANKH